jgi:hypothetical protein
MRFKEWLQQEIGLDLTAPHADAPNPTGVAKATDQVAQKTLTQSGPKVIGDLASAPSKTAALARATTYAQRQMKGRHANPTHNQTSLPQVAASVLKMTTGQDARTT